MRAASSEALQRTAGGELPEERAREWRANREAKRAEEHARLLTGLSAQRRALKVDDALDYLDKVKDVFYRDSSVYNSFLDCMKLFKKQEPKQRSNN